jgi:hypothetical protein
LAAINARIAKVNFVARSLLSRVEIHHRPTKAVRATERCTALDATLRKARFEEPF